MQMGMAQQSGAPTYLIIGNGITGITAAEILRDEDSAATIAVVADDPFPVYYRPALKDYLAGKVREDKLWARPRSFYQDRNILFYSDRVTGIQVGQHVVHLKSGRQMPYSRLLLANGANPATLKCPGANLKGVTTLRTVADYQEVMDRLNLVKRVVVTGSGTLALETIETLRHRGFQVTHLLRKRTLWSEVLDPTGSDLVLQQERRDGVDVRIEEEIAEVFGNKEGEVSGVRLTSGAQVACEMVVLAIGIEPIIDFIKSSGISCGRGVKVDDKMRSNAPDIFAAGDVIETVDAATGRTRVIGQWYPSVQQGRTAAYSMLDLLDSQRIFKSSMFYNATNLYGLEFASVGQTSGKGFQEVVADPKPRQYRKLVLKDGVPVGMLSLGNRKQALAFKRAIDHKVNLSPILAHVFNDDFKFNDWLDKQGVPLAILGANREGTSVAQQAAYPGGTMIGASFIQAPLTEAKLVPDPSSTGNLRLSETLLSQTRVATVGRQAGVQVLIDEASVSRRHAEVSFANGQYVVQDLGSRNGTFVNGQRLTPGKAQVLKANDRVRFGNTANFVLNMRTMGGKTTKKEPAMGMSMVGVTMMYTPELSQANIPLNQPVINPDGSLTLPGSASPIDAKIVATFKDIPALIAVPGASASAKGVAPRVVQLKQGKHITIGRGKVNDLELQDAVISRVHAEVFPGPGGFYVRDLESSNGVIVNQTKIVNPYLLSHGDRIGLGSSMIYFINLKVGAELVTEEKSRQFVQAVAQQGRAAQSTSRRQTCRQCGVANPMTARFCAGCSAPLESHQN